MRPVPAASGEILVRDVGQTFGLGNRSVTALAGINLTVAPGEFVSLLGPSGCGKSTLLNAVAGFALPSSGEILVDGRPVTGPGPDRGMVFQEYALFPWMTVQQNIAFGMEIQHATPAAIQEKVESLLQTLSLQDFRDRFPKDLSGGMRQRVALARVLAIDSPILLMDEPFGALDALTRRSLQDELIRIWAGFKKTILFVTHGIEESIYLSDRVVVLTYRPGTVKQIVPIALPRPRDASSPDFNTLKRALSRLVMEEQARHQQDEARPSTAD